MSMKWIIVITLIFCLPMISAEKAQINQYSPFIGWKITSMTGNESILFNSWVNKDNICIQPKYTSTQAFNKGIDITKCDGGESGEEPICTTTNYKYRNLPIFSNGHNLISEIDKSALLILPNKTFCYPLDKAIALSYKIGFESINIQYLNATNEANYSAYVISNITTNDSLRNVVYNWNGTNYTVFNNSTLALLYNFDNNTAIGENATYVVDSSSVPINGVVNRTAGWVQNGKINGAYEFDAYRFITMGDNLDMFTKDRTIEAWVKVSSLPTTGYIYSKALSTTASYRHAVAINTSGQVRIFIKGSGGTDVSFGGGNVLDNEWHYLTWVFDRDANATVYIDGNKVATNSISVWNGQNFNLATPSRIGAYTTADGVGVSSLFNGTVDELYIWDRVVPVEEIQQRYMMGIKKFNSTLYQLTVNQTYNISAGLSDSNYTYQVFAEDGNGWQNSEQQCIAIGTGSCGGVTPPADSCTYSGSGNWAIACSDNCNLASTDLNGNNFTMSGSGTVTGLNNLFDYNKGYVIGGCKAYT